MESSSWSWVRPLYLPFSKPSNVPNDRGILVPGGFGQRGTEGMMLAIKYAREQKVPFLGICLGFQLAVVEWARNILEVQGTSTCRSFFTATH